MFRTVLVAGALTLFALPVTAVRADGVPDGYEPSRAFERPIHRLRPRPYAGRGIHRYRVRSYRREHALLPATLPTHPALPLYNVPPDRFPAH
ncbi:hypothetical protein [Methylobacterium iners]|uniref:Secreted protein n=1 Tax=Methylobacterium iners TaxID=418707 RepID=A0ABQ4S021_9HYPH|nr:hypothetical protein [Methylobacterium iners]GJD96444.1 hypothetical protein OCOJLMKI_3665 [Methylobacterium iners]